jgi:pimeloyl-ACP methyl ester carboxylesterase
MTHLISLDSSTRMYEWRWQGESVRVVYEVCGVGKPILLLPAFSTVSSRSEMLGLATLLRGEFEVTMVDFPGFGDSARLRLDYAPALYHQFLADFVREVFSTPIIIVAAGHSAGYAIDLAASLPHDISKLILVAPTWRGPLPTMARGQKPWLKWVREMIRTQVLGEFLYRLNTTRGFLSFMFRRHVYSDINTLTPELLTRKQELSQQPGARFGAGAFVTGGLDPYTSREQAIEHIQSLTIPVIIALAEHSPPKSKAEMLALAEVSGITSFTIPGTLGLHEEYPTELYTAIKPLLLVD